MKKRGSSRGGKGGAVFMAAEGGWYKSSLSLPIACPVSGRGADGHVVFDFGKRARGELF